MSGADTKAWPEMENSGRGNFQGTEKPAAYGKRSTAHNTYVRALFAKWGKGEMTMLQGLLLT